MTHAPGNTLIYLLHTSYCKHKSDLTEYLAISSMAETAVCKHVRNLFMYNVKYCGIEILQYYRILFNTYIMVC